MELDCRGKVVLPGFVDSHTHPAFVRPRLLDFERRVAGASYEEIADAGGGIRASMAEVRAASEAKLADHVYAALRQAQSQGTTTLEAKSGYGLDAASEIKSLRAIRRAARQWTGTVVATFLGAHVPPPEFEKSPQRYVELLCTELMPSVARPEAGAVRGCLLRARGVYAGTDRAHPERGRAAWAALAAARGAVDAHSAGPVA